MFGGRLSKFQERLRNIRLTKSKRNKFQVENEKFVCEKVEEIKKKVREDGTVYRKRISRGTGKKEDKLKKNISFPIDAKDEVKEDVKVDFMLKGGVFVNQKKESFQEDEKSTYGEDEVQSKVRKIEERGPKIPKKRVIYSWGDEENHHQDVGEKSKDSQLKELGSDIIDKIKNQFECYLDEVDVLAGEIYFVGELLENKIELSKVNSLRKRINELIDKVNAIIQQYHLYKKNLYLDEVIEIEDSSIVDDMIAYRDLLDSSMDKKKFVKEYQALEEFWLLYRHLSEVKEETLSLMNKHQEKENTYLDRDKKYLEIQKNLSIESDALLKCNEDIMKQDAYFQELNSKIDLIQKEEYLTYQLRGMDDLLGHGLKYMGLMLLSPFSGLLPSIGYQALLTRRMVQSAYHGLHFEKKRHIHYYANDYESEILAKLSDIDYTSYLLSDTLDNVLRLKEDFLRQYQSNIPLYEDFLKKINIMEEKIIHQQNRVNIISKKLKKSQERNQHKMMKVRDLNQND